MLLKFIIGILVIIALASYSIVPTYLNKIKFKMNRPKKSNEKELYITFDDGPDKKYTEKLLDLLKEHDVKATFFTVANFAKENPDIIKRMKSENHCIALHSLEHRNGLFQNKSYTEYDFNESMKIMRDLKVNIKFYRPPWGHINMFTNKQVKKHNLQMVTWDVMAQDWEGNTTVDIIESKLLKRSKNKDVICLHDGRGKNEAPARTIEALSRTIPIWKKEGYKFLTMEDYYG